MSTKDGIRRQQKQAATNGELTGAGAGNREPGSTEVNKDETEGISPVRNNDVDKKRAPTKPAGN